MNKILIISDTHCHIRLLDEIVTKENCAGTVSAILHCGDLGVYDEQSLSRISAREKSLLEKHQNPFHEFFPYIRGERRFPVPIFMIPGNHEDFDLVGMLADGQIPLTHFTVLKPSLVIKLPCGQGTYTVMGIGGILPEDIKPSRRHQKKIMQEHDLDQFRNTAMQENPDILLLHEPPYLARIAPALGHASFGNSLISALVKDIKPRIVFAGHMHFEYEMMIGSTRVFGLGYGAKGRYCVLYEDSAFEFKDLQGSECVLHPVSECQSRPRRVEKARTRPASPLLPVTGKEIIEKLRIDDQNPYVMKKLGLFFRELRKEISVGKILTRHEAIAMAERFLYSCSQDK